MEDKKITKNKIQNILLENRQKLSVSGVSEVDSFNDEYIIVNTEMGVLLIRGQFLKINRLNLENGELLVEGNIYACEYTEDESSRGKNGGFLARLFK